MKRNVKTSSMKRVYGLDGLPKSVATLALIEGSMNAATRARMGLLDKTMLWVDAVEESMPVIMEANTEAEIDLELEGVPEAETVEQCLIDTETGRKFHVVITLKGSTKIKVDPPDEQGENGMVLFCEIGSSRKATKKASRSKEKAA